MQNDDETVTQPCRDPDVTKPLINPRGVRRAKPTRLSARRVDITSYNSPFVSLPTIPPSSPLTDSSKKQIWMQEEVNAVEAREAEASSKNSTQRLELKMLVAIGTLLCSLGATLAIISGPKAIPVPVKSDFPALSGLSPAIRDAVKSAKFDEALNLLSSVEPKNIDCEHLSYWETKLFCLYNTRNPLFESLADKFTISCPDADYPRLIFARWMIRETSDTRPSWTNRKNTISRLDVAIRRVSGIIDRYEALTQKGLSSLQARTLLDSHDLAGQIYMLKWRYSWNPGLEPNEDRANAEYHFQRGNSRDITGSCG